MSTPLEEEQGFDHFEARSENDVQFDNEEVLDHRGITLRVVAVYLVKIASLSLADTRIAYTTCRESFSSHALV